MKGRLSAEYHVNGNDLIIPFLWLFFFVGWVIARTVVYRSYEIAGLRLDFIIGFIALLAVLEHFTAVRIFPSF